MDVKVVDHEMPAVDCRVGRHCGPNMIEVILFGAGRATGHLTNLPGCYLKINDETARAVPNVFKFPAFNLAGA